MSAALDDIALDPYVALRVQRIAKQSCDPVLASAASAVLRRLMPEVPCAKQGPANGRLPRLVRPSEVRQ